jgi:hypothetical protein
MHQFEGLCMSSVYDKSEIIYNIDVGNAVSLTLL